MIEAAVVLVVVAVVFYAQDRRIKRLEKSIVWFTNHIRIDDRDLEKSPPPDDLLALTDSFKEHDE